MNALPQLISQEPVLVAPDLRLRQFILKDASNLQALHEDPALTHWLLDDVRLDSLSVATDFIHGLRKFYKKQPGLGIWALERLEQRYCREQLIEQGALTYIQGEALESLLKPKWFLQGWFNLTPVPEQPQYVELGSRLHRSAWGQRIACSVGEQLVNYAFDVLGVSELYLHCHPLNRSALYCAAFLGFDEPEAVEFLGSHALRLRATMLSCQCVTAAGDSARRRAAFAQVHAWTANRVLEPV